ncbi:RNA polymerase sigma factor [Cytophagaceae bacterium DM2B3-1]|uniref:RNA polymerase sigma factor n=1 Tax=Xanthocytophaga flava TaxID=3048013 RepID=A0ABT7CQG2_9BACT|nr:RNA polymerase sigma factor [Xanthocytophaga flavus]MDJ1467531.1 RNA polymerase sigma factor [Xanthocytophaga flavus]MDJ1494904.1 RNA polymerase sigma factor [Xanthocytophaga flavus]
MRSTISFVSKMNIHQNEYNVQEEFLQHRSTLESYLYRLCGNREDAKDLVHDTYLKAVSNFDSFKGNSTFKTWVFAIATNLAKDNYRVQKRWPLNAQDLCRNATESDVEKHDRIISAFESQSEPSFDIVEHMNYCFTCMAKNLTLQQQIALILKEIYQFKRNEIASILQMTEGVVKHLLFEARKELQEKYEKRCALINKNGPCYQCAELNDYLSPAADSFQKLDNLKLPSDLQGHFRKRFSLISKINPLTDNGALLEDTIMRILNEAIASD